MKKRFLSFIPQNDGELAVWAANFKEKIALLGPDLGLLPADISDLQGLCQTIIDAINKVKTKRAERDEAIKAKNQIRALQLQLIINVAITLKRHPNYKPSMGGELGIIGSIQTFDPEQLKPTLKATPAVGKVVLVFNLQNMSCVSIYSRIKGTMGWSKLGNDYLSPYEDRRPLAVENQPEIREYMIAYFNGREDVGRQSDIVTVTYGG